MDVGLMTPRVQRPTGCDARVRLRAKRSSRIVSRELIHNVSDGRRGRCRGVTGKLPVELSGEKVQRLHDHTLSAL